MPYVNVYNQNLKSGTVTNLEGYFEIPIEKNSDTIVFSFVGFETYLLIPGSKSTVEIVLKPITLRIDEVVVIPEGSNALYTLLHDCAKSQPASEGVAKSYLELKSFIGGNQVELLEGYYNADFSGYELVDMNLKTGRVGIRLWEDRFFVSVESSQAITRMQTFGKNSYFPSQPTEFNRGKMKRNFQLRINGAYTDESGDSVVVIDFFPKLEASDAFSGKYWVKPEKKQIQKLELEISDPASHPFRPLFPMEM